MDKQELIHKISTTSYTKDQLLGWVNALPKELVNRKPNSVKIGDVFMHSAFKHPCVILQKKKDDWLCGMLTTEETCTEILEPCESRFFQNSFFTKALFTVKEPIGMFVNVYDNPKQLRKVLLKLKSIFK